MRYVIYDWASRPDFLLRRLYPQARIVKARPLEDVNSIIQSALSPEGGDNNKDLWVFHLNLSDTRKWFPNWLEIVNKLKSLGCRVVNDRVVDIRKSTIQKINCNAGLPNVIANQHDEPSIKVIVKTDYNYGGATEAKLSSTEASKLGLLAIDGAAVAAFDDYYVCCVGDISEEIWNDKRIVIERYVNNDDNRFYRFYRCGSRVVLSEVINKEIIKKMNPGLPRRNWYYSVVEETLRLHPSSSEPTHYSLHRELLSNATKLCITMGLEFGALDVVVDQEDRPYIIDVNPTPGWGLETHSEILDFLRDGF